MTGRDLPFFPEYKEAAVKTAASLQKDWRIERKEEKEDITLAQEIRYQEIVKKKTKKCYKYVKFQTKSSLFAGPGRKSR